MPLPPAIVMLLSPTSNFTSISVTPIGNSAETIEPPGALGTLLAIIHHGSLFLWHRRLHIWPSIHYSKEGLTLRVRKVVMLVGLLIIVLTIFAAIGCAPAAEPTPTPGKPAAATPAPAAVTPAPGAVTPAAKAAAPRIPHPVEGRENCVSCHTVGGAGAGQPGGLGMPANHEGRTNDSCRNCHSAT